MRASTAALYAILALAAKDVTQQAIAHPAILPVGEPPEASNLHESVAVGYQGSVEAVIPPEQLGAIAFAEAVLGQYSQEVTDALVHLSSASDEAIEPVSHFVAAIAAPESFSVDGWPPATPSPPEITNAAAVESTAVAYAPTIAPPEMVRAPERASLSHGIATSAIATPETLVSPERLTSSRYSFPVEAEVEQTATAESEVQSPDDWAYSLLEEFSSETAPDTDLDLDRYAHLNFDEVEATLHWLNQAEDDTATDDFAWEMGSDGAIALYGLEQTDPGEMTWMDEGAELDLVQIIQDWSEAEEDGFESAWS